MQKSKNAFTMIELVFVIVVLGILAAVAIPKFAATRTDAQISKARADISSIRSAIVTERQSRLIKGDSAWISQLHGLNAGYYFDGVDVNHTLLTYGIKAEDKDGGWHGQGTSGTSFTYKYKLGGADNTFAYNPTAASVTITGKTVPGWFCMYFWN